MLAGSRLLGAGEGGVALETAVPVQPTQRQMAVGWVGGTTTTWLVEEPRTNQQQSIVAGHQRSQGRRGWDCVYRPVEEPSWWTMADVRPMRVR